jgi:hypothetical protein
MEEIGIGEKVKGFLFNPVDTFKKVKEETLGEGFRYFIVFLVIYSILSAIAISATLGTIWGSMFSSYANIPGFGALFGSELGLSIITFFIMFLLFGLIGIFLSGAIIHLGVRLFGGKRGYGETVKALIYGGTPSYIFGWIPLIGPIFALWAFILEIFGIRELQDLSTGKALAAILVPILIIVFLLSIAIAAIVYVYVSSMLLP